MKITILTLALCLLSTSITYSQVRPIDRSAPVNVPAAPETFEAKYEGGMFGYSEKQTGRLQIDDINERIVFYGKDGKEKFALPYASMQVVFPQSRKVTSNTGNVVRHIPLPGSFLGGLIKEKWRYMVISFQDPDVDVSGAVNFKISSKELLDAVIRAIGTRAGMTQRGDAFYRPKPGREI